MTNGTGMPEPASPFAAQVAVDPNACASLSMAGTAIAIAVILLIGLLSAAALAARPLWPDRAIRSRREGGGDA